MTHDDRLAAARAALARAEEQAAAGEGFLAAERERAERTAEAARGGRRAAREERRADRAARRSRRDESGVPERCSTRRPELPSAGEPADVSGGPARAGGVGGDLFGPERAAAAARMRRDRRRRGLADDGARRATPGSAGRAIDADHPEPEEPSTAVDLDALGSGEDDRRRQRRAPRSPFAPPPDEPGAEPDPHEVARQIVLRQLAMAARSRGQLRDKLAQKGCPPDVAETVLDRMEQVGLVDDEAYAQMLVRSQVATRGLARRGLAHELRKKGIDTDLADAALDEIAPDDERRTARALVDKKLRTMGGLAVEVQTRRLAGMLARKGYSAGLAYAVIRDAIADAPEHQRD